jgi:FtsP/CotA-like multicopper oxidase with cupredoxin domain
MLPRSARRVLTWIVGLVIPLALIAVIAVSWVYTQAQESNVDELDFGNPLAIPPPLEPEIDADGRKVFDLAMEQGETQLLSGTRTVTWGANGTYLGPTLRARRGDDVRVRVTNSLTEPTTLHWHGMALPGAMDGGPHQMIQPGEVWQPEWRIDQPAAALWYHPHAHHRTADHVYRGIAGLFIIDDDDTDRLSLPNDYGVDDIPVIVQDKQFDSDGSLRTAEGPANLVGVLGDEMLVNGTHNPHLDVTDRLVRLRLLNASNARVYDFGFDDDRRFALIASDSGLLDAPADANRVQLSPGERAEIVVELRPGDRTTLRSYPPDLGMSFPLDRTNGGHDTFDILQIRAADRLRDSQPIPRSLASIDRHRPEDAAATRVFELSGFSRINGREMDLARIDQTIARGDTEIWEIHNSSNTYHNFHVHLVHFQILDIDGDVPPPELAGWKDTVFIPPAQTVRIISRFDAEPDPSAPFMYHCHILDHEDAGMMGQFAIIDAPDPTNNHQHPPPSDSGHARNR